MFVFDFPAQIQSLLNQWWYVINYALSVLLIFLIYQSYKNTARALGLIIILFPTYLIRTNIFGIPTTFLELSLGATIVGWLIQEIKNHSLASFYAQLEIPWKIPVFLLLCAATLSIFVSPEPHKALGLWKAYFIEPIIFFYLLINHIKTEKQKNFIFLCLGISTLPLSLLAVYQKISGFGIAEPSWVENTQRRVTSIFTSPNALGLYLGPIAVLYFGWLVTRVRNQELGIRNTFIVIVLILNMLAIIFTQSQGTWFGLLCGLIFLSYFLINKKLTIILTLLAILIIFFAPPWKKEAKNVITFQDQAGRNRIVLWQESFQYLTSSAKHFIFGAGIFGFPKIQEGFRNPSQIEPLLYPHNFFLNFWMETGMVGLFSIVWIIFVFFKTGFASNKLPFRQAQGRQAALPSRLLGYELEAERAHLDVEHSMSRQSREASHRLIIMAVMIEIIVHGLIDVPYFKNDLSILFWTMLAGICIPYLPQYPVRNWGTTRNQKTSHHEVF